MLYYWRLLKELVQNSYDDYWRKANGVLKQLSTFGVFLALNYHV